MENIILILSNRSQEIKKVLDTHYKESVKVINAFETPTQFYEEYKKHPIRVDRIIVSESGLTDNPYAELQVLKTALESFYIKYKQVFFLVSDYKEINELMDFFKEDLATTKEDSIRVFSHKTYTAEIVIEYCLNKIAKKHQTVTNVKMEEVVRVKKNTENTFILEEQQEDNRKDLVVLEDNAAKARILQEKLNNINSLSNVSKGEEWINNKIIRDIRKVERMKDLDLDLERYDIDYTQFELSKYLVESESNIMVVTGEQKSGTSTIAYALAKSSSNNDRTLVIDFNIDNLGMSYIVESLKDTCTVMLLQSFMKDFKNSLQTIISSRTKLNVVALNTKTKKELGNVNQIILLALIANSSKKYFDTVILDIPIRYINDVLNIVRDCSKIITTVSNRPNDLMSLIKSIKELDLVEDLVNSKTVIIPSASHKDVKGISKLKKSEIKEIMLKVYKKNVKCLSEIEVKSFDVDHSLFSIVKNL